MQAALARIAALEPRLRAFMHLDAPRAIAHVQAIDGPARGQLEVQDLLPPQGSVVNALLRAGCVILGKLRTTEFALIGFNLNRSPQWNPCDVQQPRMTGGSSHGSAVAMAAGMAGFTVGSDTGGSVRWPAALYSVFGYKASSSHGAR